MPDDVVMELADGIMRVIEDVRSPAVDQMRPTHSKTQLPTLAAAKLTARSRRLACDH